MKELFSIDGKLFQFFLRLWDIIRLNVCWGLCSLPAVPLLLALFGLLGEISMPLFIIFLLVAGAAVGAANTAVFYITLKMADDTEGYIFKPYFRAYATNFRKGSLLGMMNFVLAYALYLDIVLFDGLAGNPMIYLMLAILAGVILVACFLYAYALTARYENSIINTLKNSAQISFRYIFRTLILLLVIAVEVAVFLWNTTTIFIGLFIVPASICLTISGIVNYIFKDIEKRNQES